MTLGFLRTRVGQRYLAVNLLSAILPLAGMSALSYVYVRRELQVQAADQVLRLSKTLSISTLSALAAAANDLRQEAFRIRARAGTAPTLVGTLVRDASRGVPSALLDTAMIRPLTAGERSQLQAGRLVLALSPGEGEVRIFLGLARLPWRSGEETVVWGRVDPARLWSATEDALGGEEARFCVIEALSLTAIHCSPELAVDDVASARAHARLGAGQRTVESVGPYILAAREAYLRHEYGAQEWQMVAMLPTEVSFRALASFGRLFFLLMVGVTVLIFLISHAQIRRITEPLARLQEGTRRLQGGDFSIPVTVTSGDEYEELATSFNGMAHTLDRQLLQLRDLDAIDQAALTAREVQAVTDEALHRTWTSNRGAWVTVALSSLSQPGAFDVSWMAPDASTRRAIECMPSDEEREELLAHPRQLVLTGRTRGRSYLEAASVAPTDGHVVLLPLVLDEELLGLIALGRTGMESVDVGEARRLADRVGMAMSNVRLVRRLDALSAGTLIAFARAIDANSKWTAGHSERVTRVAMVIGRQLQLRPAELDTLERGGLLHDIGKISVPPTVLNKAGPLSDDEWLVMKRHPIVGFDILSPIPAFADALPLVRSHHEKLDGRGYPDGLRGEQIPFLARVLAVADVFDALVSDRPYRPGLSLSAATDLMKADFANHLDSRVMVAFLDAVRRGAIRITVATPDPSSILADAAERVRGPLVTQT